jgi:hypothetical protein
LLKVILTMFAKLAGGLVGEEVDGDEVYVIQFQRLH